MQNFSNDEPESAAPHADTFTQSLPIEETIKYASGDKYVGETLDGLPHGKGTYKKINSGSKLVGEFINGLIHGKCTRFFAWGAVEDCYYVNNRIQGFTTVIFPNGSKQTWEYKNGDRVDLARSDYQNAKYDDGKYYGQIKDGKPHGKGAYHLNHGKDFYEGDWVDGKITGKGIYYYNDGNRYEGDWVEGKRHGKGTWIDAISRYEGEWSDGKRHGTGEIHPINTQHGVFYYIYENDEMKYIATTKEAHEENIKKWKAEKK